MLNQVKRAKNKWGGRHTTIDNWLHERMELLIQYCDLAGVGQQSSTALPDSNKISDFCEILMDYLSAGHFEVYDMLVADDNEGSALKQRVYPKLAVTTDEALAFNDAYVDAITAEQAKHFDSALAKLGETLEERFELEDELIAHMHNSDNIKQVEAAL